MTEQDLEKYVKDTYTFMGSLNAKMDNLAGNTNKLLFALIGVIAAMIGVKVIGSDPLLDIATAVGLISTFLVIGVIFTAVKFTRNGKFALTTTGKWLLVFLAFSAGLQVAVYIRDLGHISPQIIYIVRIFMFTALGVFAWCLMGDTRLVKKKRNGKEMV